MDEIIIYQSEDGAIKLDVTFVDENVWLTQAQIGQLFNKSKATISEHISNVFAEGELNQEVVVRNFRTTTQHGAMEGKTQESATNFYNLDVIISVGYRVKSKQGTQFRIWATQRLRDYIIKGFALNDERFKTGSSMNYFRELLDRIREIRLSERMFYQQIKDTFKDHVLKISLDGSEDKEFGKSMAESSNILFTTDLEKGEHLIKNDSTESRKSLFDEAMQIKFGSWLKQSHG